MVIRAIESRDAVLQGLTAREKVLCGYRQTASSRAYKAEAPKLVGLALVGQKRGL
jgi:hypothetical protein